MSRRTNLPTTATVEVRTSEEFKSDHSDRPSVLVVDDECAIADTLTEILTRSGFHALTAYDGASALDAALLNPPKVLITDVVLPGMSGIDLAVNMRHIFPECKVLLFSGNASTTAMLASATRAGHNFVLLAKPVHPREILAHVSACMEPSMRASAN